MRKSLDCTEFEEFSIDDDTDDLYIEQKETILEVDNIVCSDTEYLERNRCVAYTIYFGDL